MYTHIPTWLLSSPHACPHACLSAHSLAFIPTFQPAHSPKHTHITSFGIIGAWHTWITNFFGPNPIKIKTSLRQNNPVASSSIRSSILSPLLHAAYTTNKVKCLNLWHSNSICRQYQSGFPLLIYFMEIMILGIYLQWSW